MSDPDRPPEEPGPDDGPSRVDAFLRPLFTDSTLWPILIVVMTILGTFFASVLLMALRQRNLFAVATLLALAWLTLAPVQADLRGRRLGPTSLLLLLLWLISGAIATIGAQAELL